MALTRLNKPYYTFSKGINTDASLINFPEDFSTDEENFLLDTDGSRFRRRGLQAITTDSGLLDNVQTFTGMPFVASRVYRWEAMDKASGTSKVFLVVHEGLQLYFYDGDVVAPEGAGSARYAEVDLSAYIVDQTTYNNDPDSWDDHLSFASGNGDLFVAFKHINPIRLKWNRTQGLISATILELMERDFVGIEDGVGTAIQPSDLSSSHEYNLLNRGWKSADITAFETSQNKYPAKNMIPWLGYRRETTSGVAESDWTKYFSPAKLVRELFGDTSAPQGHLIRSPYTIGTAIIKDETTSFRITTWTTSTTTSNATATITVTTDRDHGLAANDVVWIEGQLSTYLSTPTNMIWGSLLNGQRTVVSAPTTNTFTFTRTWPTFSSWLNQYFFNGTVYGSQVVDSQNASSTKHRPSSIAWYAGRVWYAGVDSPELRSKIYFSQVVETESQYSKCYQVADPTDERINILVATDGGVIVIPEMIGVKGLVPHQGRLLVFATNGVWEVSGGNQGYFTADNYTVRKISEIGCTSEASIVLAEDIPLYMSYEGIYSIQYNPYTERMEASSISVNKVDNLLKTIPAAHKLHVQGVYDRRNKRVWWLYSDTDIYNTMYSGIDKDDYENVTAYNCALVYDLRFQAFQKMRFYANMGNNLSYSCGVFGIHVLENVNLEDPIIFYGKKYKSTIDGSPGTYGEYSNQFFRLRTDNVFMDFELSEKPAYLVTGYDTLTDSSVRKYPIYVTCYLKKTETGYTISDNDLVPVNSGSLKLQARWDWADNASSGKWSAEREVYRHARLYIPTGVGDAFNDGQPLIVTKNKVRGTGRAMHLKFTAGTGSDAKILGWQVLYAGTTEP